MRLQKLHVIAVVAVSCLMAALRTVIVTSCMEKNAVDTNTYYLPDSLEVILFAVVSAISVFTFFCSALALGKKRVAKLDRSFGSVQAGSLILAFSLVGAALIYGLTFFGSDTLQIDFFGKMVFVFTILSAVRFLYCGLRYNTKRSYNTIDAITALAPIMLSMFRLFGDFIRTGTAPLASSGAYHIIGLIIVMLFFLCEGKSYVSDISSITYIFFGYLSIYFLLVYSLPNLVLHCFGTFRFDYLAAYSVVDLGLVVYISARLASSKNKKKLANLASQEQ